MICDIHLHGGAGVPMVPISWVEMQCPETKAVEKRKVAKVTAAS
jgi:exosome complex component CSL4